MSDLPTLTGRGKRREVYPFSKLEIGESIWVADYAATSARNIAAMRKRMNPGWDYRSHKEGDGVRIWRTA